MDRKIHPIVGRFQIAVLLALLLGALAGCVSQEMTLESKQQAAGNQKSIVLVHGGWMGGWVWDDVATYLRNQGHRVVQVTLPGHDSDPLPASQVTMELCVAAVSTAVHSLPLPVHLVGHSMAGVVISQYAESEPATIQQLIYFAAFVPQNGETLLGLAQMDTNSNITQNVYLDQVNQTVELPISQYASIVCPDCNAGQSTALTNHYRGGPLTLATTPLQLTPANFGSVNKRYFFTNLDQGVTLPRQQAMAATTTMSKTISMNAYHCPHVSQASQFSDKLLTLMK